MLLLLAFMILQVARVQPFPQDGDIVVTARRLEGSQGPEEAEDVIEASSVKDFGADSIGELIARLRIRYGDLPIVVNGRRLASIEALTELPPEAVAQIEMLRPGSGGRYGYSGTCRVLNLILQPKFASATAEGSASGSTDGGGNTQSIATRYARIRDKKRFNGTIQLRRAGGLRENQRLLSHAIPTEQTEEATSANYRSLIPRSSEVAVTTGLAIPVRADSLDLSFAVGNSASQLLTGLYTMPGANAESALSYTQQNRSRYIRASATLAGTRKSIFWSILVNGDLTRSEHATVQDRMVSLDAGVSSDPLLTSLGTAPESLSTVAQSGTLEFRALAGGPVARLSAGDVHLGSNVSLSSSQLASVVSRMPQMSIVNRYHLATFQVNTDIPIINRNVVAISWLGNINLNADAEYTKGSQVGDSVSGQAALNWSISRDISLAVSTSHRETPASIAPLYAPVISLPGSLVYDWRAGSIVSTTLVNGGNPNIRKQAQSENRVRLSVGTGRGGTRIAGSVAYSANNTSNPLFAFSNPSALVEVSMPTLFLRDGDGRLIQYDARPFSGASENVGRISSDIHLSGRFAEAEPSNTHVIVNTPTSWDLSASYEFLVHDKVVLDRRLPAINVLVTPFSLAPGALSRHRLSFEATLSAEKYGLNLSGSWRSGFRGVALEGAQSVIGFSSLLILNAEGFINFGKTQEENKPSRIRFKLEVDNLLNQRVRGPGSKRPDIGGLSGWRLDPLGRIIRISARKTF